MLQINKKLSNPFILSILSGLLLFAAWPMSPFTFLIFFAFIPLLHLSNLPISNWKYFGYLYMAMFIWNISTTWWIWFASPPGAVAAFIANSFLMCLPWLLYRKVKKRLSGFVSYVALICFWMMWEYTHLQDWGLSWPWLTVGNVFAAQPSWIQWYKYTGVSGGTLWILLGNIYLYFVIVNATTFKKIFRGVIQTSFLIIYIPIIITFITNFYKAIPNNRKGNIVISQPNIDPYAKLETMPPEKQLQILLETSKQQVDSNTQLLIWPETALYSRSGYRENDLFADETLLPLQQFLQQYPNLKLFTGIESIRTFEQPTSNSRTIPNTNFHYESYNSSVLFTQNKLPQFYHKSMLVPGVETLPSFLNFMGKWFEDFGGTTNGYTKSKTRIVLNASDIKIAPSICYESIYGEFMSKYVNNGANLITIITNDGWWRNTPGHQQHFAYAKLRAIENRCYVARSANTGISGFISPFGDEISKLGYNQNGAIKVDIENLNYAKTFYTQHPDLLYKIATIISVFLMLWFNIKIWVKK